MCIDGSKVIPFEQVNDDYCDCEDGSDEPGKESSRRALQHCEDAAPTVKYTFEDRSHLSDSSHSQIFAVRPS